jgi:transposase InsO family protein
VSSRGSTFVSLDKVLPGEKKETTAAFLTRALLHCGRQGVKVRRILTDNGMCYHSNAVQNMCQAGEIQHTYAEPYRTWTNGKVERFIQTALREWAYRLAYKSPEERTRVLEAWLHYYNHHRPHSALGGLTPALMLNNILGREN